MVVLLAGAWLPTVAGNDLLHPIEADCGGLSYSGENTRITLILQLFIDFFVADFDFAG
jgi:hypothetical protein